ncbi:hypothetical protein Cadr_000010091 [Camelus dromedarius]|uniref:Uncharacterized protein n=1 Tax=Camelus dromedarius TaxID=9838 RepID=A0A5N4DWJ2_CAMDR|nr:hypothetical protein Cadr_000010091 [Camelus dromedarius]
MPRKCEIRSPVPQCNSEVSEVCYRRDDWTLGQYTAEEPHFPYLMGEQINVSTDIAREMVISEIGKAKLRKVINMARRSQWSADEGWMGQT